MTLLKMIYQILLLVRGIAAQQQRQAQEIAALRAKFDKFMAILEGIETAVESGPGTSLVLTVGPPIPK